MEDFRYPKICFLRLRRLVQDPNLLIERGRYICADRDDSIVKITFLNMLEKPQSNKIENLYYYIKAMCEKIGNRI